MRDFGTFVSTSRFCTAFEELRSYLRARRYLGECVSLIQQRQQFCRVSLPS